VQPEDRTIPQRKNNPLSRDWKKKKKCCFEWKKFFGEKK